MKRLRNKSGFTLAELMVVVAIVVIVSGVGFVSIGGARRALHHREMDSYAKEIFVAAQNHLSMAKSQGALADLDDSAKGAESELSGDTGKGIYYFAVGATAESYPEGAASTRVLDLMLPFGAIDETVRTGGSYIVRYQFATARVLDVFYTEDDVLLAKDYAELMKPKYTTDANAKRERQDYNGPDGNLKADVGWFGGAMASQLPIGKRLKEPTIEVVNGARLTVNVENPNAMSAGYGLKLVITGQTSGRKMQLNVVRQESASSPVVGESIQISAFVTVQPVKNTSDPAASYNKFSVVLDDVTDKNHHFADLTAGSGLLPGENILIWAQAYDADSLTNVAYSSGVVTNSLFAAVRKVTITTDDSSDPLRGQTFTGRVLDAAADGEALNGAVIIGNFRHMQNLNSTVSGFTPASAVTALQVADLDWARFASDIGGSTVKVFNSSNTAADAHLWPVNGSGLKYYGTDLDTTGSQMRLITGLANETMVRTSGSAAAGVFGTLTNNAQVKCITAVNCNAVSASGSAGGLVGVSSGATISSSYSTCSASGSYAGGLVGSGSGSIMGCYATGLVKGANVGAHVGALAGQTGLVGAGNYYLSDVNGPLVLADTKKENLDDEVQDKGTPMEKDKTIYQSMVPATHKATPTAKPFNSHLPDTYDFKTVATLTIKNVAGCDIHYGDWPIPGGIIVNTP